MIKKIIASCMVVVCLMMATPLVSVAGVYSGSNVISNNIHDHVYTTNSVVSNSYMMTNSDGTITRIENMGDVILYEKYNSSFQLVHQGTIPFELSYFGGCYSGVNYNYLIFGQENPNQDNNLECIRIVKYTKNWVRVSSAAVTNCNTRVPFCGSGTDFCEYGNYLYIRCGHQTYRDANGYTHQSSMTISYRSDTNKVTDVQSTIQGASYGSVENSGAQFIDASNGVLTAAEHSMTAPYAAMVTKYSTAAGKDTFRSACSVASCVGSTGALGTTVPAFSLGGYEVTSQYYLMVGNSQPMDGTSTNRNIFVAAIPKNSFATTSATVSYLTGFAYGDAMTAETPYLVRINDNKFAILWEQRSGYSDTCKVYYTFIDGAGKRISDVASIDGCLSDCQPVVYNNKIVWYTTNGVSMKIYTVSLQTSAATPPVYNTTTAVAGNTDYSVVFDYGYYISTYPDMRVIYGNNEAGALQHFLTFGMAEGRQGSANFNVNIYRENYPDLQAAFGNDLKSYYLHFVASGNAEGRNGRTSIR